MTRKSDSSFFMQRDVNPTICKYWVGLWECAALTCQRCALAPRCRLSQVTARGARMCQDIFFPALDFPEADVKTDTIFRAFKQNRTIYGMIMVGI